MGTNELLKRRTVLITGATSGIGYAIAEAFLRAGATVVIAGRNKEKVDKTKEILSNKCDPEGLIFCVVLDVLKTTEFKDKVKEIIESLPSHKIDILVNNAGVGPIKCTSQEEKYDIIMDTNVKAIYFLSGLIARHMIDNGIHGNILNIASSSSLRSASSIYGISKWGVRGLTEGLAKLLIPHCIVVNAVGPGLGC